MIHRLEPGAGDWGDNHLGDSHARGDRDGSVGEVYHDRLYFSPIVRVYRSRSVEQRYTLSRCQAGTRPDLRLVTWRELNTNSRGYESSFERGELHRKLNCRVEVRSGGEISLIDREIPFVSHYTDRYTLRHTKKRAGSAAGSLLLVSVTIAAAAIASTATVPIV